MGYTHYFTFEKPKGTKSADLEAAYTAALLECAKVVRAYQAMVTGDDRLSGYTAHTKPGAYGGLQVNGKGENAHEPFELREHFSEQTASGFGFCKTARKPYDVVVTACLAVLKYRLKNAVNISSDGSGEDWDAGVELARRVLKRSIKNPIEYRNKLRLVGNQ